MFVSDLWQVNGFLRVLRFPPPIRLNATILLKVIPLTLRGLTILAKERRLDFPLRGQEGEVIHRDMLPQTCVVSSHHLNKIAFYVCLC